MDQSPGIIEMKRYYANSINPMRTLISILVALWLSTQSSHGQKPWTEADKTYLLDNFRRTRAEINRETATITPAQWNFREAPGKWAIGDVLEHLTMWELITLGDARYALYLGPNPERATLCKSDSITTSFIYEEKPHISPDFTVPTGLVSEGNNLKMFNLKCDEIIRSIETSTVDFRQYVREGKDGNHRNLAQLYIIQFGHVDRHLRQIRKVKQHPNYPSATLTNK